MNDAPRRIFSPGDLCKGGRYKIFDLLGAGGMCEVWRAFDDEAPDYEKQWVAVKVLKSKLAFDEESTRRLEKEARTLLDIDHENLVRVFHADVDEDRNIFFYVMELLQGETLEAKIKRTGGLDLEEALRIVSEVAGAAHSLHLLGIIHRDLKPENIYVTADSRTVVLDLGVAKFDPARFPQRATQPTEPNTILGTCPYMSPEQCFGSPLDPRSDVYALGLIAYACIAGFHAAQGSPGGWMPQDYKQWAGWHINNHPKPLPLVMPWLHKRVWKVISKALAKDPAERQGSAEELSAELEGLAAWLKATDLLQRPAPMPRPAPEEALPLATTEQDTTATSGEPPSLASSPPPGAVSVTAIPSPRTASGTEILRLVPTAAPGSAAPRTAGGTEILRSTSSPPAASIRAASDRGERATAAPDTRARAARTATSSGASRAAPMPMANPEKQGKENNPRASQGAPTAHTVSIGTSGAPRTSARRMLAFGGGGLVLGVGIAALVVGLGGFVRRDSASPPAAPALTATNTASSSLAPGPTESPSPPALLAPAAPVVPGSAASTSPPTSPPGTGRPKTQPSGATAAPRKPTDATPPQRPKSDRIRD